MTRTLRVKAASISSRTKSLGSSRRRRPSASVIVSHSSPTTGQQHIAISDRTGDHLDEVVAQFDRVDVLEDLAVAVAASQPVVQPAS
jgi:hypothetical protein